MSDTNKIFKYSLVVLCLLMFTCCAPARKNTYYQKRKRTSHVHAEQLGRNKYFFSPQYQKKLSTNYKRRKK